MRRCYAFQGGALVVRDAAPPGAEDAAGSLEAFTVPYEELIAGGAPGGDVFTVPGLPGLEGGAAPIDVAALPPGLVLPPPWKTVPLRQVLDRGPGAGALPRLLRAYHLIQWRAESRYCGSCGSLNQDATTGEVARQCPVCGRLEFPRISPAVITLITNHRDEALLAHNRKFAPGVYSLIAGFNEAGEALEDTVVREIREEVGVEVGDVRYVRSQSWPFPNSLMLGFTARYVSGDIRPDGVEIEDARWFSRDALPALPGAGSISRYLINRWVEG